MKCPHCGAQIGLEDNYCPFCGQANTFAKKHQEDMKYYQQEFQRTQSDVYQQTQKAVRLTIPIVFLLILLILNIAAFIFVSNSWKIGTAIEKSRIHSQLPKHEKHITQLIKNGDFCGLSYYFSFNSLYYADELDTYTALVNASDSFRSIYELLLDSSSYYDYAFSDEEISQTISSMVRNLNTIFNIEQEYSFQKELYFTDETTAALVDLQNQTKSILVTYAGLTPEEAASLPDLSSKKQQELLERRLSQ